MRFGHGYGRWLGGGFGPGRGEHHEWGHHERGRGRRRMFDGGELRLVLLALLEGQPRHGYDLIREIEERTGGSYAPSPGVVYPTLTMLDEMGHIDEVKEEGSRKRFAITDAGKAFLAEKRGEGENKDGCVKSRTPRQEALCGVRILANERVRDRYGHEDSN